MKKFLIFIVIIGALAGFLYWQGDLNVTSNSEEFDHTNPITEGGQREQPNENESSQNNEDINNDEDEALSEKEPSQTEGKREANPIISNVSKNSDGITVRTVLNDAKNGTCTLTFTKDSHKVVETAPVGLVTDYYVCQGFRDIPRNKFPEGGTWNVVLEVESSEVYGKSETRQVTL